MDINCYKNLVLREQEPIYADLRMPAGSDLQYPLVILSHGFKAFKDWGFFPYVAEEFTKSGFISICWNFSKDGAGTSDMNIHDVENFAQNTVAQELKDIQFLIEHLDEFDKFCKAEFSQKWNGEIILMGHSLGAAVSILTANKYHNIKKLLLWASVARVDRYSPHQKRLWKEKGFIELKDHRNGIPLRLNSTFVVDIEQHYIEYDLLKAISQVNIPILIIHSQQDFTVLVREADALFEAANKNYVKRYYIATGGHTFGISHKMVRTTTSLNEAVYKSVDFLKS